MMKKLIVWIRITIMVNIIIIIVIKLIIIVDIIKCGPMKLNFCHHFYPVLPQMLLVNHQEKRIKIINESEVVNFHLLDLNGTS